MRKRLLTKRGLKGPKRAEMHVLQGGSTTLQNALGQADAVRRPEAEEGLPDQVPLRHRPEEAGVEGVRAVVPHHKDVVLGDGLRAEGAGLRRPAGAGLSPQVWLLYLLVVYEEVAVLQLQAIARDGDDALYQGFLSAVGALEEDDVAAVGLFEVVGELVDQEAVPDFEGGNHALGGDVERGGDDGPDEAEDENEGDQEYYRELEEGLAQSSPPLGPGLHARAGRCGPAARSAGTPRPLCSPSGPGRRPWSPGSWRGCHPSRRRDPSGPSWARRSSCPGTSCSRRAPAGARRLRTACRRAP